MVEDGYEFFAKRQLVTLFSAPNYCGEFDNAGAMMSVDETLMCSFQILKVSESCRSFGTQVSVDDDIVLSRIFLILKVEKFTGVKLILKDSAMDEVLA